MSQKIQIKSTNKMKYDYIISLLCYGMVVCLYKTSTPFDQITTLTYVVMGNFCTCCKYFIVNQISIHFLFLFILTIIWLFRRRLLRFNPLLVKLSSGEMNSRDMSQLSGRRVISTRGRRLIYQILKLNMEF